jgi:bifunctional DNA-binding transcriptional regulator/antitoxin component of YhaV-PrlF toxin-antitoxin module
MKVTLEQDGDELIFPIPDDVLGDLGWTEGDTVEWIDNGDGSVTVRKV